MVRPEEGTRVFTPSAQQEDIYTFIREGTGHGVVIARAGTGKTSTIVGALEHVRPFSRVLCCAFNRRIRDELEKRVPAGVKVQTLHQLGRATMHRERTYKSFVHDDDKDIRVAREALNTTRFTDTDEGRLLMDDVAERVRTGASLTKALLVQTRDQLIELIKDYDLDSDAVPAEELAPLISKAVKGALDAWPATSFDDEIWIPVLYGLGLRYYDVVFVDECQDLTLNQLRLAQSACHQDGRIVAVGDPAQAIYGWRGADDNTVQRIINELGAPTFPLSVSFRCPRSVVALAKKYVPDFEAAADAPDGRVVAISLADMFMTAKPGDYILSRTNAPLAQICLAFVQNKVPARIIGQDVGKRIIGLLKRSRAKTVSELMPWLAEYEEKESARLEKNRRPRAAQTVRDLCETLRQFAENELTIPHVMQSIDNMFVEDKRNYIICSTVHKLKGDEANRVFVLDETFFLTRGDPVEERNIHYVAVTRAKRELFRVYGLWDKNRSRDA